MHGLRIVSFLVGIISAMLIAPLPCHAQRPGGSAGTRSNLGLGIADLPAGSAVKGVLVRGVAPGGDADVAGIRPNDIITVFNNTPVTSMRQLMSLASSQGAAGYTFSILRDGKTLTITIGMGGNRTAAGPSPTRPFLGLGIKDLPKEWGMQGVLVQEVLADFPADEAGMIPGDIVTELAGKSVLSQADFLENIAGLKIGDAYVMTVRRGGQFLKLNIAPAAAGGAAANAPASFKHRSTDFNVLKYAVIDPRTRVVTLLGSYDPKYATGTIPYYDLLKNAMATPYPSFSLEPTQATRAGIDAIDKKIGNDVARMYSDPDYCNTWTQRLLKLILNEPSLQLDRIRLIKRGAEIFKISELEMQKALAKSSGDTRVSDEEMMPITSKVLRGVGLADIADAMDFQAAGNALEACDRLGLKAEAEDLVAKFRAGQLTREQATVELETRVQAALQRGLGVPEAQIQSRTREVRDGRMGVRQLGQLTEKQLLVFLSDAYGLKLFNGWTLSHALLSRLYDVPLPQVTLDFRDVAAESVLGDFLYNADFMLKTICTSPGIQERVPGFLTEHEFYYAETRKKGMRIPAEVGVEIGHRLVPGEVKLRVAPNASLVAFDTAQVRIVGWLYAEPTGTRATAEVKQLLHTLVTDYANYLTDNYDNLARAFPQWHRLRETAKIIALARWAKTNNFRLVVDKAHDIRLAPPKTTTGFWQAFFTADQKEFSLTVIAEGGASFSQQEGEAWIKPTVNAEVVPDVLRQLAQSSSLAQQAAGAALDGNLEAARDLADKSARAMTGDFDHTELPSVEVPLTQEPAPAAALSNVALRDIDESLRKIENAKVTITKADAIQATAPTDAARMREMAQTRQEEAEQDLRNLRNALDIARKNPQRTGDVLVSLQSGSRVTPPSSAGTVAGSAPGVPIGPASVTADTGTGSMADSNDPAARRAKLVTNLAGLHDEMERVKKQFMRLNKQIQDDQKRYEEWEKVADEGMQKCGDVFYGLLMDFSAGRMSEYCENLIKIAKPGASTQVLDQLVRTKRFYDALDNTQSAKDVHDLYNSVGDASNMQELFESLRDGLNQILQSSPLKDLPVALNLKYWSYVFDAAYSYAQFQEAYYADIELRDNRFAQLKAFVSLRLYMDKLLAQIKADKEELSALPPDR